MKTIRWFIIRGQTDPAPANGNISKVIPPQGEEGQFLVIERITTVVGAQAAQAHFGLYENDQVNYVNRLEFTDQANFNIADEASPIRVDAAQPLIVNFDTLDLNNVGYFRLQCRIDDPREQATGTPGVGQVGGPSPAIQGQGWG